MTKDLCDCFQQHLATEVALTGPQLEDALRLRYRVYCEETGFEDPEQFPDGLERDHYDAHSLQMLVRHRPTGSVVGAVRLIMPCWWESSWSFPFETVCTHAGEGPLDQPIDGPRHETAEVSRFAVSRNALAAIQQRDADRWKGPVQSCDNPRRPPQLVALGLIALLFGVSAEYGINRWYAMMEASLARHLSKLGIDFQRIGPAVEHRGKRYPMMARVDELLASIATRNPAFGALISEVRESVLAQGIAASDLQPSAHPLWTAAGAWQPGGPFVTPPRWRDEPRIVGTAFSPTAASA